MHLGFIGLGRMGSNMVRRLMKDGHHVVAYNRTPEKTKELAGEGATGAYSVEEFVGLVLPGGVVNADILRTQPGAVALVRAFVDAQKPVAAICHAAWTLIEAGAVKGRTITSWPSLRTDLVNAGAEWVDEAVHVDDGGGWTLVSSRNPGDLPAFCREAVRAFAA